MTRTSLHEPWGIGARYTDGGRAQSLRRRAVLRQGFSWSAPRVTRSLDWRVARSGRAWGIDAASPRHDSFWDAGRGSERERGRARAERGDRSQRRDLLWRVRRAVSGAAQAGADPERVPGVEGARQV